MFPVLSNIFYWTVQVLMYVENYFMKWTHLELFSFKVLEFEIIC